MRISDWSSDVCSSDLGLSGRGRAGRAAGIEAGRRGGIEARHSRNRHRHAAVTGGPRTASGPAVAAETRHFRARHGAGGAGRMRPYRSEEGREGKEGVRKCRYRWSEDHEKKKEKRNA